MIFPFYLFVFFGIKQVGTLDVLVGLSDELAKLDSFVERYAHCFLLHKQKGQHFCSNLSPGNQNLTNFFWLTNC